VSAVVDAPTSEPVLLLHSSASSAQQWHALVQSIEPRHEVHALDFHGHGAQPAWASARPMRLADDAALARHFLESTQGAHLVGHSYGGAVALHIAARWPHLVRSLVVYEPVTFCLLGEMLPHANVTVEVRGIGAFMRASAARGDAVAAARRFIDFWSGAGTWDQLPPQRQQGFARRVPAVIAHFDALWAEAWPDELAGPSAPPMRVLSGDRSPAAARTLAALLRTRLPHAHHETLAGLGHMGPITDAAVVNARVADALRVPGQAPTLRNSSRSGAKFA
jgi:pimeloyl-ACP methyl ester carboxylesterase